MKMAAPNHNQPPPESAVTDPVKTTFPRRTMVAAQGKELGDIDAMIEVRDDVELPSTPEEMILNSDVPEKDHKKCMIIRCHAVALACGDVRVMSGLTRELQGPPSFPYIPGGDCAGTVFYIPEAARRHGGEDEGGEGTGCPFQVGDRVAVRFNPARVRGALAEYAIVDYTVCDKLPDNLSFEEGAVLASIAPAMLLSERIKAGERVLIMGAGGGVGSHAAQIMRKKQGASFIAGVSRTPDRLLQPPLSYDRAIDYTKQDPFDVQEFKEDPFDVVVDLAGAGSWLRINEDYKKGVKSIVKPASQGGRYLTLTVDTAIFEFHSMRETMWPFLWVPLFRALKSRLWGRWSLPKYTFAMSLDGERSHLTRTLDMAKHGELKAVIDPKGPFPLTSDGVKSAFHLQESRHIQGKVVVQVQPSSEK